MTYDEFIKSLYSPYWWIMAFVFAIAANLISTWLKIPVDKTLASVSTSWTKRQRARTESEWTRINILGADETKLLLFSHETTRTFIGLFGITAVVFWIYIDTSITPVTPMGKVIYYASRVGLILFILWAQNRYDTCRRILQLSIQERERIRTTHSSSPPGTDASGTAPGTGQS